MTWAARGYVAANVVLGLTVLAGGGVLVTRSGEAPMPAIVGGVLLAGLVVVRFPLVLGEGAGRQLFVVDGAVFTMAVLLLPPEWAFLALATPALTELFSDRRPWDRRLMFVSGVAWSHAVTVWAYHAAVGDAALPVQVGAAIVGAFASMAVYNGAVALLLRLRGGTLPSVSRLGGFLVPTPGMYGLSTIPGAFIGVIGREGLGVFAVALVCAGAFYLMYSQYRRIAVARHRMGRLFDYTAVVHTLDDPAEVRALTVTTAGELLSADGARLDDRPPHRDEVSARVEVGDRTEWLVASRHPTAMATESEEDDHHLVDVIAQVASGALEKLRLAERLRHEARHDALTGAMNRPAFEEDAGAMLARARRDGTGFAVLYGDLDGFKPINDRWGHRLGDEVLRLVAERLRASVREGDLVARIGGDEFLLLLHGVEDHAHARAMAERVRTSVAAPMAVDGHGLTVDISLGVARWPDDGTDLADLLRVADIRMYDTKRRHRREARSAPAADVGAAARQGPQ